MPKLFYDFTETLRRRLSGIFFFQEAIHVKHNWWFLNTEYLSKRGTSDFRKHEIRYVTQRKKI